MFAYIFRKRIKVTYMYIGIIKGKITAPKMFDRSTIDIVWKHLEN